MTGDAQRVAPPFSLRHPTGWGGFQETLCESEMAMLASGWHIALCPDTHKVGGAGFWREIVFPQPFFFFFFGFIPTIDDFVS